MPANGLLILGVLAAAFWVDLTFTSDFTLRLLLAKAAVFQVVSMGLLARGARRSMLQTAALLVGVVAPRWLGVGPGWSRGRRARC